MTDKNTEKVRDIRLPIEIGVTTTCGCIFVSLLEYLCVNAMAGGWGWSWIQIPWVNHCYSWLSHLFSAIDYALPCIAASHTALLFWLSPRYWVRLIGLCLCTAVLTLLKNQPGYWILVGLGVFDLDLTQTQKDNLLLAVQVACWRSILFLVLLSIAWALLGLTVLPATNKRPLASPNQTMPQWRTKTLLLICLGAAVVFAGARWTGSQLNPLASFSHSEVGTVLVGASQVALMIAGINMLRASRWLSSAA